ncbi:hypothetical protein HGRIS_011918 [Hohenbuehelia grisea]|uniref:Amino acid permease/ SLC12A domain-containing protein n=1 Tax=Hohenbuehelia grisea TaxID=104357 RepID=A0ABR3JXN0_9AGAR
MFCFIGIVCIAGGLVVDLRAATTAPTSVDASGRTLVPWPTVSRVSVQSSSPAAFSFGMLHFGRPMRLFRTFPFIAGTELVGLAASETPNPRETMPAAIKGTFWRITIIYITSLAIIGLLLPGASVSPFVIALDRAGIKGINHLINATICVSVLSIGLSCVYAGSRTLTALAETGYAPKVFTYVEQSGRPLFSVLAILAFAPIAYVNVRAAGDTVFTWLLALSGLSTLFTWLSICLCQYVKSLDDPLGHLIDELPFKALGGVWGSWFGVILITLVLIAQFYV